MNYKYKYKVITFNDKNAFCIRDDNAKIIRHTYIIKSSCFFKRLISISIF